MTAANCALLDNLIDASFAYLATGWSYYCQGKMEEALENTEIAIGHNNNLVEALFQKAKILMASGKTSEAFTFLGKAIDRDTFYAIKAAGDGDFQKNYQNLKTFLVTIQHEKNRKYQSKIAEDLQALRGYDIPADLKLVMEEFAKEKTLLEIGKAEIEWHNFKLKPWFFVKHMGDIKVEFDTMVKVVEPYREKVITRPASWLRKEESKLITKSRIVEKKKRNKYFVQVYRDTFTFFTGKVLADYEMMLVEGGKYQMGDTSNTGRSDEKPVQNVQIDSFLICSTQVVQKVWNFVMSNNPANFEGYNLPVEQISWYDCIEFCNKLSIMAGFTPCYKIETETSDPNNRNKNDNIKQTITCDWKADGYRLASEAEWEFAAKGGNNSNFFIYSGSDDVNQAAWFKDNSGYKTQNVAQKQANELGLYDMSGNVWEWCWDWYVAYGNVDLTNPRGPAAGAYRLLRGGSWADSINYQRCSGRGSESPFGRYSSIGFRLVRAYIPPK
jgi:formylglycine-generating enzyme required for sulfatase activity